MENFQAQLEMGTKMDRAANHRAYNTKIGKKAILNMIHEHSSDRVNFINRGSSQKVSVHSTSLTRTSADEKEKE